MKESRKNWLSSICWFAAASLLLLGGVAGFVVSVDPYQIYHPSLGGPPRFNRNMQRFSVPGLARRGNYEIAVLGTSFLQNIPNSSVRRLCGGPAVNLCLAGASIHEEAAVLALVLKQAKVKTLILTLDYNSLAGGAEKAVPGVEAVFPAYLYDDSVLNKLPYVLSFDSVLTSYRHLHAPLAPEETTNSDWPWKFPESMEFSARHVVKDIDPSDINKNFRTSTMDLESMKAAFAANMFPLLGQGRDRLAGVKIHFVFPPYSILVWHDYAQRNQIPTYLAFKKWVVEQADRLGTFDVVDYQDRADIITNLSLYADIYHFSEGVTEQVVQSSCSGDSRLTRDNVEARTQAITRLVQSTNPFEIVKHAAGE